MVFKFSAWIPMSDPSNAPASGFKALWAKLNSDPTAAKEKRSSPNWLTLQWEPDGVVVVDAKVSGDVQVRQAFEFEWTGAANPKDSPLQAGLQLKEQLAAKSVSTTQTAVIVPREMAVVRRLELPAVPDDELPDLVRFQAVARASTPLERLALDYIPVASTSNDQRTVLLVTIDAVRLRTIQAVVEAAGLTLAKVSFAPVAIAALLSRAYPEAMSGDPVFVVWQKDATVELSLLHQGQLTFSHAIQLSAGDGEVHVKPLEAELSRAMIAMSQQHPGAQITQAFLTPGENSDPAVRDLLQRRFPSGLTLVEPGQLVSGKGLDDATRPILSRAAPAIGQLVAEQSTVAAIDFLNPRKKYVPPDRRKEKMRVAGGAAVLLGLVCCWWYFSAIRAKEAQIEDLKSQIAGIEGKVKEGAPTLSASQKVNAWKDSNPEPLSALSRFSKFLPTTEDLYFVSLKVDPPVRDSNVVATITGKLYAKNETVIRDLQDRLRSKGYKEANPKSPVAAPTVVAPYTHEYDLTVSELPPPPPQPTSPAKSST